MNKKPILVTGGCGFVGRHIIKKLLPKGVPIWIIDDLSTGKHPDTWLKGWEKRERKNGVVSYNKNNAEINFLYSNALPVFLDMTNKINRHDLPAFSDVFHLASIVGGRSVIDGDPMLVGLDLAIDSTLFLWLTRQRDAAERILYASSSAAYPTQLQVKDAAIALKEEFIKFDGGNLGQPDMTYGWSKMTGEYLSVLAHQRYGLHVACIRPFSGYGEDQDASYPVPAIARRIAMRKNPIEVWGSGKQGRDFIYIDDVIDMMFQILDKVNDGRGINIGTGKLTTFLEIIEVFKKIEGYDAEVKPLLDKPVGVQLRYADTAELFKIIGKPKFTPLEDGLSKVLDFAKAEINNESVDLF
ncbi:MAG: NAD-dependent epimerase/dehydratase family protein [Nitrospinae bacterium]|nr:NAD-dependent epimerase/dehydratase family protein [Nitrospinota bacterium]MBI3813399.1 NAD-dependent epimerase/dehydratase family protein [Nitrospinota bacterium]